MLYLRPSLAAVALLWLSAPLSQGAEGEQPLWGFRVGPNIPSDGELLLHTDGNFYGTTLGGGASGAGTIFRLTREGGLDWFSLSEGRGSAPGRSPDAGMIHSSDGWMWGTAKAGGIAAANGFGGIFRYRPETNEHQLIVGFGDASSHLLGKNPTEGLSADGTGWLWGASSQGGNNDKGVVYKVHEATGVFEVVIGNAARPWTNASGLVKGENPITLYADPNSNYVWGLTGAGGSPATSNASGGTVFRIDRSTTPHGFITVGEFSRSSAAAVSPIVHASGPTGKLAPDGLGFLWGATSDDANTSPSTNFGSLFKVDMAGTTTAATTVPIQFTGTGGAIPGNDPLGHLVRDTDGLLWGVTRRGGTGDKGTIFALNPATNTIVTHIQIGSLTGANAPLTNPVNPLVSDGAGYLWGLSLAFGNTGPWHFYKVEVATGTVTLVKTFLAGDLTPDGRAPLGGLMGKAGNPWLYGTTSTGGEFGFGTLFRYNLTTQALETLVSFSGTSGTTMGDNAQDKLHIHTDGTVWGITRDGGATGFGTVFKFDPATLTFTHLATFTGNTGAYRGADPAGKLTTGGDGFIWGSTVSGGDGSIFKINPATNAVTSFKNLTGSNSPDGSRPTGLVADSNGILWGFMSRGGGIVGAGTGYGTIFKIDPTADTFETVLVFTGGSGANPGLTPAGNPVFGQDGKLWGRLNSSAFKYDTVTGVMTIVPLSEYATFPPEMPFNGPGYYVHEDGLKYGTLSNGGSSPGGIPAGGGSLFRLVEGYPSGSSGTFSEQPYPEPVTLSGGVGNAGSSSYQFEWGSTSALGQKTTLQSGQTSFTESLSLSGLTTYYYRTRINGPSGPVYSPTVSFFTRKVNPGANQEIMVESPLGQPLIDNTTVVHMGALQVGKNTRQPVIVRNIGQASLSGLSATMGGANPEKFVITTALDSSSLAGMGATGPVSTFLYVTYTPGVEGTHTATLTITNNDANESPFRVLLTGSGVVDPDIQVEQPVDTVLASDGSSTVDFGSSDVGEATDSMTFTVKNVGLGTLNNVSASLTGPHFADFSLTTVPSTSIASNGSGNLIVGFTPSAQGTRSATLVITSSDPDEGTYEIALTGEGLGSAEIVLEMPVGTNIESGGTAQFGSVIQGQSGSRTFTLRNTGTAPLTVSASIPGQPQYQITTGPPGTIPPGESATFVVTLTPLSWLPVIATMSLITNDADEGTFTVILNGSGAALPNPQFPSGGQPASRVVLVGQPTTFASNVTGNDPKTYQWKKNGSNISGAAAKEADYSITSVKAGDAGAYTVEVSNDTPPAATSPAAFLGVVAPLPETVNLKEGATLTLTCAATAPPGFTLTYSWIHNNSTINGLDPQDKVLKITGVDGGDTGTYSCTVLMTPTTGSPISGSTGPCIVTVLTKPVLSAISTPAPMFVSETVNLAPITTVGGMPAKFTAKGLPTGVKLDPDTGVLSGKPTTAKTYTVVYTATNAAGKSEASPPIIWIVNPLTDLEGLVGTFNGLVERHNPTNSGMGGFIQITTTTKGSVSGSATLAGKKYSLKGVLDTSTGNDTSATLKVKRAKPLTELTLTFSIETGSDRLSGTIFETDENNGADFSARRNIWTSASPPDTELVGPYTAGIVTIQPTDPDYPHGDGYTTLAVSKTGVAKWAGKTGDGATFTFSTVVGPDEEVILHAMLYKGTGSIQGLSFIDDENGDLFSVQVPAFDWVKLPNSRDRLYGEGIELHPVDLLGGKYTPANNLFEFLEVEEGNVPQFVVADISTPLNLDLTITAPNKVSVPNTSATKLSIKATTGVYSGSFTDGTPARKATVGGVLVRNTAGSILRGYGFYTLPTTTDKASPIISGKARIEIAD